MHDAKAHRPDPSMVDVGQERVCGPSLQLQVEQPKAALRHGRDQDHDSAAPEMLAPAGADPDAAGAGPFRIPVTSRSRAAIRSRDAASGSLT
jgi:hypothetical protein